MVVEDILIKCVKTQLIKIQNDNKTLATGSSCVIPSYLRNDEVINISITMDINTGIYYLTIRI